MRKFIQKYRLTILPKSVFALIMIACCGFFSCNTNSESGSSSGNGDKQAYQSNSGGKAKIQSVEVIKPQPRPFSAEILISGTALPNQTAMIHAMESGYLSQVNKDIGDKVSKGEKIAVLQNPEIGAFLAEASSAIAIEEATLQTLQSETASANADEKTKKSLFDRLNQVFKETPQLTPIAEVEKAEGQYEMAKAKLISIQAKINAQQKKIDGLKKKLEFAKTRRNMQSVTAPFSGIVTKRFLDKGSMVQSGISNPSAKAIFEIQDIDPIRLTLPVPESDAASIKKGMEVNITFPELPNKSFQATVSRTSNALDPLSKTMQVEIDVDNADGSIVSGMYAKARLQMASRDNVLSLPITAVKLYQDVPHVLVVEDEIVKRIELRKGLTGKDYFEVLNADINKETMVIIQGKGLVKNGDRVKPVIK